MDQREKDELWRKQATVNYHVRIMKSTGLPDAIEKAAKASNESIATYFKKAIVTRLRNEGFVTGEVVLNANKQKHQDRIARLKKYIEEEEAKL